MPTSVPGGLFESTAQLRRAHIRLVDRGYRLVFMDMGEKHGEWRYRLSYVNESMPSTQRAVRLGINSERRLSLALQYRDDAKWHTFEDTFTVTSRDSSAAQELVQRCMRRHPSATTRWVLDAVA